MSIPHRLSAERLRQLLTYQPETGLFFWNVESRSGFNDSVVNTCQVMRRGRRASRTGASLSESRVEPTSGTALLGYGWLGSGRSAKSTTVTATLRMTSSRTCEKQHACSTSRTCVGQSRQNDPASTWEFLPTNLVDQSRGEQRFKTGGDRSDWARLRLKKRRVTPICLPQDACMRAARFDQHRRLEGDQG